MPSKLSRTPRDRLLDIRDNIDAACAFVQDMAFEIFVVDQRTVYAVIRALEIISEASRHVPEEVKARYASIPWREIAAAGNIYRHVYGVVDPGDIWKTVQDDLPLLHHVIVAELSATDC